jgi:hypothetical protein
MRAACLLRAHDLHPGCERAAVLARAADPARIPLKRAVAASVETPDFVREGDHMARLLLIGTLVCVAAPAFAFGILSEPPAPLASMVWIGLAGLAIAGSRNDPRGDV